MKCPKCHSELTETVRHKLKVDYCPSCKGMWLEAQELGELEDETFDLGEHAKGTLALNSTTTNAACPECSAPLQRFNYRFFDLQIEMCPNQHGYWLDENEDNRVLKLMKQEEKDAKHAARAERQWTSTLHQLRSHSLMSKIRDLFH